MTSQDGTLKIKCIFTRIEVADAALKASSNEVDLECRRQSTQSNLARVMAELQQRMVLVGHLDNWTTGVIKSGTEIRVLNRYNLTVVEAILPDHVLEFKVELCENGKLLQACDGHIGSSLK